MDPAIPVPRFPAIAGLAIAFCGAVLAAPEVVNPSFEADSYGVWPGYVGGNGGVITGWRHTGHVGLNPTWQAPKTHTQPRHAFDDNAKTPHGRQVAFIQDVGTLSQTLAGFEVGKKYRVTYYENARHNNAPDRNPRMKVTLGGEVIVSDHTLKPVETINRRTLSHNFVESAVFTAPKSGAFELKFATTTAGRVAVLIDQVAIAEVRE